MASLTLDRRIVEKRLIHTAARRDLVVDAHRLPELVRESEAADTLLELVTHGYAVGAFAKDAGASPLARSVIDCHAHGAGLWAEFTFAEPEEADGLRYRHYRHLSAVDLASVFCLVVSYYLQRRWMGPTQIGLLVRDAELSIADACKADHLEA